MTVPMKDWPGCNRCGVVYNPEGDGCACPPRMKNEPNERLNCTNLQCQHRWNRGWHNYGPEDNFCPSCKEPLESIPRHEGPTTPCTDCDGEGGRQDEPLTQGRNVPICETCRGLGDVPLEV